MSVYCASKWSCTGWSDSLRLELEQAGHHHVKVTTVNPTYISTGMFEGARTMLFTPIMTPEYVTTRVWKAMKTGRPRLIMPWTVHASSALRGLPRDRRPTPARTLRRLRSHRSRWLRSSTLRSRLGGRRAPKRPPPP